VQSRVPLTLGGSFSGIGEKMTVGSAHKRREICRKLVSHGHDDDADVGGSPKHHASDRQEIRDVLLLGRMHEDEVVFVHGLIRQLPRFPNQRIPQDQQRTELVVKVEGELLLVLLEVL
jgi:hypothetical protein